MTNTTFLPILLVAVGIGLSFALVGWLIGRAISNVPDEDREYKDPPPAGFRLIWWPIQWISFYLEASVPAKMDTVLTTKLRKGGLDYALRPVQFIAARIVCGACASLLFVWALGSFDPGKRGEDPLAIPLYLEFALAGGFFGWMYPAIWLRDRLTARRREVLKSLPFYLDIITLCVEAGLNLQGAINQAVLKGPKGVLRDEFQRVLRDIRAGKPRAESLRNFAARLGEAPVTNFVASIIQAERMGMSLGPVLRAQADQQRVDRFLRGEKLAMEAPVKMLFPLIAFIFPCTFIVLFFPIVIKFLNAGI